MASVLTNGNIHADFHMNLTFEQCSFKGVGEIGVEYDWVLMRRTLHDYESK